MSKINELLKEDSKISSMRWALVQVTRMSYLVILSGCFHIIYNTLKSNLIEWSGIALLLAGLTAFIGAAVTGKWLQKKEEVK